MSVLVVGGVFREVFAHDEGARVRLAGSGLYAATAAARLGARVALLAPVGTEDGEIAATLATAAGVRRTCFLLTKGASGTFAYDSHGSFDRARGFRPAEGDVDESVLSANDLGNGFSVVLVFGHPQWDPCASELVRGTTPGTQLLFDRQGWISRNRRLADAIQLPAVRRLSLANFGERIDELGLHAALSLDPPPEPGYDASLVKDGRWGVSLIQPDGATQTPAYRVESTGDLGSGDVFAGALAAGLDSGQDVLPATRRATAAAGTAIAEAEPLPGPHFAASVEALIDSPAVHPVLSPSLRAAAELTVEHPGGALGSCFGRRIAKDLAAFGFHSVGVVRGQDPQPTIRIGADQMRLISDDGESIPLNDLVDWVVTQLTQM